ncbi:hypothetical protein VNO80_12946 [Phaseolus coccineus]|uniref:Uncharacterized protein n=1 Tax=Phaseolus coccineus TaxID=3886 RepID=A0AAN9R9N7_PHACN
MMNLPEYPGVLGINDKRVPTLPSGLGNGAYKSFYCIQGGIFFLSQGRHRSERSCRMIVMAQTPCVEAFSTSDTSTKSFSTNNERVWVEEGSSPIGLTFLLPKEWL